MSMTHPQKRTYIFVGEYPIKQLMLGSTTAKILMCQIKQVVIRLYEKTDMSFYKMFAKFQSIQENLIHPHLLQYREFRQDVTVQYNINGTAYTEQYNIVISEYLPKGTLNQFLRTSVRKSLEPSVIKTLFSKILDGLKHLSIYELYHSNLNPHNLIFDQNMNIKIAGYLSMKEKFKLLSKQDLNKVYYAPEVFTNCNHDRAAALIYSCGVLLFVITYHLDPNHFFSEKSIKEGGISYRLSKFPKVIKNEAINTLIDEMTRQNPLHRPSLEQIENHPWFKNQKILNNEQLRDKLIAHLEPKIQYTNKNNIFNTVRSENIEHADPIFDDIINKRNLPEQKFPYKQIPTSSHFIYLNQENILKTLVFLQYSLKTQKSYIYPLEYEITEQYQMIYTKDSEITLVCSINQVDFRIKIRCHRSYDQKILLEFDASEKSQHTTEWIMDWLLLKIEWISCNVS